MKYIFLSTILFMMIFVELNAQDDKIDDLKFEKEYAPEEVKPPYFGIGIGYSGALFFPNFDGFNSKLSNNFSFKKDAISAPIFQNGFELFTSIPYLKNVKVGFERQYGSTSAEFNPENNINTTRVAEINYSSTGLYFEYCYIPSNQLAISFGAEFAEGELGMNIYQSVSNVDWNDIDENKTNENFYHETSVGFICIQPQLSVEYALTSWALAKFKISYPITFTEVNFITSNKWTYNHLGDLKKAPTEINANGPKVQLGFYIGIFNIRN